MIYDSLRVCSGFFFFIELFTHFKHAIIKYDKVCKRDEDMVAEEVLG